ncbi:MAG: class I SAM-dependent methyltransferase [Nanoarchaeota archaeon]|nr:class I SAM-dependent methyltransferase [Nanoarchaeota archaeon]
MDKRTLRYIALLRKMNPFLEGNVLDYGCGDGAMTSVFIPLNSTSNFFAYDGPETNGQNVQELLNQAKILLNKRARVIERKEDLPKEYFDTITLICMLHGNENIIEQCHPYLKKGGHLIVIDHDKKHLSDEEYIQSITDADRNEILQRSYNEVLRDHTKMDVYDCCRITRSMRLRTVKTLDHRTLEGFPFYLCVSEKN